MPRRKRRLASRIRNYLRNLLAFLFSNVGVVVLVVAYIIAGAFMFQAIEGASEIERAQNMTLEREKAARCLWEFALELNVFNESALKDRITIKMQDYQRKIVLAVRRGWNGGRSSPQWSFSSAFLYSLTVITAIGYGHISPRTSWGKVATILYTLLGMPLFLLYLANVGELLARWFKCIYALVCLCRGCPGFTRRRVVRLRAQMELSDVESIECPEHWRRAPRWSDVDSDSADGPTPLRLQRREHPRSASVPPPARAPPLRRRWSDPPSESVLSDFSYVTFDAQSITVPISVCVAILVGYIMFGSMIFGMWENWDQLDGAYFCFISLSRYGGWWTGVMFGKPSIGFGDFVPGERVYTEKIETSFIVCSVYLMLGMALVAMCFNLMQEQVRHYFAGLKRALKRICRCKR